MQLCCHIWIRWNSSLSGDDQQQEYSVILLLYFFSFFWRKQKINVSKSGLYKPNLKLMSISTAEGQMWKQRFILEVWSGLVSLALAQRADSQACQEFPRDFPAEASLEASECAAPMCCSLPHCWGMQCVVSPPPVIVPCFSKLLKPSKTLLGETWVNRMELVSTEVNAQPQRTKRYQRRCRCMESLIPRCNIFIIISVIIFWAVCKEMAYISWSFCTHRTVLWGLSLVAFVLC